MWDASRLEQLVTNLLANTIKFGPGRPIEIRIGKLDGEAELVIRDHGIGIDPARLPMCSMRFERAVSWTHYGGLGSGCTSRAASSRARRQHPRREHAR